MITFLQCRLCPHTDDKDWNMFDWENELWRNYDKSNHLKETFENWIRSSATNCENLISQAKEIVNEHKFCEDLAFKSIVTKATAHEKREFGDSETWAVFIPKKWIEASPVEISSKETGWKGKGSDSKKNQKKKKQ